MIHEALTAALNEVGPRARLIAEDSAVESAACFEKPVAWDVVDGDGRKLAGAGQRRTRRGLLHQGSVVPPADGPDLFEQFAGRLATEVKQVSREPSKEDLAAGVGKFCSTEWVERR